MSILIRKYIKKVLNERKEEGRKVIAFDFHDTLIIEKEDGTAIPRTQMINKLKDYYKNYNFIVIYTAAPESKRALVSSQLKYFNIPYDVLVMEKPRFDIMYDDRYVGPNDDWC